MDFELTDDQLAFRDAAADLLDDLASPARVRTHLGTGDPYDGVVWKAIADQGWLGIPLGEEAGGLGLGAVEVAVVLEEVGRHVAPVPFLESLLALETLAAAGSPWAERLVTGEAVGCVAEGAGSVTVAGDRLHGRCGPVIGAPGADVAVVATDEGTWAVDLGATGARPAPEPAMDLTRSLGWLVLDGVRAEQVGGSEAAASLRDRAGAYYSAEMLGIGVRVLDMAVEYAKHRVQFGRPIGSFQAVKHRCADMLVDVEGMRSVAYYAAWCIGAGHPEAPVATSTAKIWCSDAVRRVTESCLQVHGGIGFTWEHDLHLYLKRAQLDQVSWGDAVAHRARLAALLRPRVEAGDSVI